MMIINPGSGGIPSAGDGWTNTYEGALAQAHEWWDKMRAEGICDVELLPYEDAPNEGRWTFRFRHSVTGVVVTLETHGIDDLDAYMADGGRIAYPRVYWDGSSSGEPQLSDWHADGFEAVQTYRAKED